MSKESGVTFHAVEAPATGSSAAEPDTNTYSKAVETDQHGGIRAHIAVIDDSRFQLAHLCDMLSVVVGWSVMAFEQVDDDVFNRLKGGIDLIIVDQMMPSMTGIEFVRKLRTMAELASVPVVMLTSSANNDTMNDALEAGVTRFETKPIHHVQFRSTIRHILNNRRIRRSKAQKYGLAQEKATMVWSQIPAGLRPGLR